MNIKNNIEKARDFTLKRLIEIIAKSNDIRSMTVDEYEIYIDDYIKKSKYPDINEWIKI